jgi:hypothetical protein
VLRPPIESALRTAVGVDHDHTPRLAAGDRGAQGGHGEPGGHPLIEGVADDPVAEQVLDRAAVELAFGGRVLGDVGDPHPVRRRRGEVPLQVIIVHGRAGQFSAAPAALAHRGRPQLLLRAQPPDSAFAGDQAGALELVGQEPVAELRVVAVGVDQGVGQVGVLEVALADGVRQPGVVRLPGMAEHPAGQPRRDALGGQVTDQRVAL